MIPIRWHLALLYIFVDRDPYLQDNIAGVADADGTYDTICTRTAVTRNFITLVRDGKYNINCTNKR